MSSVERRELEAARDGLNEVSMAMIAVNLSHPAAREELMPALSKIDGAVDALTRALEEKDAAGGEGGGAS
jgi:hypothetical protein